MKSLEMSENTDSKEQRATTRQGMIRMLACLLAIRGFCREEVFVLPEFSA
jgi:hypothetical protein